MNFRTLTADEIDCRVSQITEGKGLTLLLYKNARVDMDVLDETVGAENWQRAHDRNNANCIVSIWDHDKHTWVMKEDTGTESNTEAEKGLASDSFKRACVNWGIGRELYSAPFIWVNAKDCNIKKNERTGKPQCYDRFSVVKVAYDERRRISELIIRNETMGRICFEWYATKKGQLSPATKKKPAPVETPAVENFTPMRERVNNIVYALTGGKPEDIASAYHFWTEARWHKLPDIPDDELPMVLAKAESLYRKRNGHDYE